MSELATGRIGGVAVTGERPRRGVFAVAAAGGLLVALDVSVANAVLPAIGADFAGEGRAAVSWVITGYAIVFAATLVPAGRIADRAGRRRTLLGGLVVFALGSLLCGVAPSLGMLLAGRAVQGVGAAAASPASLGLLLAATDSRRRATYAARWTGAGAVGVCLGPLVGGALTTIGDWRLAFLVNLPVIAVVLLAAPRVLPETPRHPGRPLPDPVGAVVLALAAAGLTLGLSEVGEWGLLDPRTVGSLVLGLLLATSFVRRSGHVAEPVLDLALMRHRRVAVAATTTFFYSAGFFAFLLTFMLFFVDRWGLDLVQAGSALLPAGVVVVLLTTSVGGVADRVGYRPPLVTGASLMAVGLASSTLLISGRHLTYDWFALAVLIGVGIGLCYPLLAAAAVHGLASAHLAAATALNQSARQLGAALGVAAAVGVLGPAPAPSQARYHAVWLVAAGFSVLAAATAALLPADRTTRPLDPPEPSPTHDEGVPTMTDTSPTTVRLRRDEATATVVPVRPPWPAARHLLPDGSGIALQPLEPGDADLVREIFDGLGAVSRQRRFLGPKNVLTTADLDHLTAVDHVNHVAVVAMSIPDGRPVGMARFVRAKDDDEKADVAVVVVDDWQSRGVGGIMATTLVARARELRVRRFSILMAYDNSAAIALMHRVLGDVERVAMDHGTVEFVGSLPPATAAGPVRKGA